ncbi:MAG: cell envelope integrity protein CreD [Thalassovita sp.]
MFRSVGFKYVVVILLTLLMFIPMLFVSEVVDSRKTLARDVTASLGQEWGGPQVLVGPVLRIPVQATVDVVEQVAILDPTTGRAHLDVDGNARTRAVTKRVKQNREPLWVLPEDLVMSGQLETQVRYRGIYQVPVYQSDLKLAFNYDFAKAHSGVEEDETILWDRALVVLSVSSNAALRGATTLAVDGVARAVDPAIVLDTNGGIQAEVGDPRNNTEYALNLGMNGAASFKTTPVGRNTSVKLHSDWPHPSFVGRYLPDASEVSEEGFSASWTIPHLARTFPQTSRDMTLAELARRASFGVAIFQPNDFYQKAYRASRYAILFIALTFLTILLLDQTQKRPTHPIQYLLVGLAQATFVLLMVAYAEQIGFLYAYVLSSSAITLLLTMFGWAGLGLGRRTLVLSASLVVTYAALYFILVSVDYALLAGATLAFVAIAAAMFGTRNEDWYARSNALAAAVVEAKPPSDGKVSLDVVASLGDEKAPDQ